MTAYLDLLPRDPVVVRDGRPFGAGSGRRMKSLAWPLPSVVAGSLRTMIGKARGGDLAKLIPELVKVGIGGPFPVVGDRMFLPAPRDFLKWGEGGVRLCPTPLSPGEGADMPNGLHPVCAPPRDGKPSFDAPAWWSVDRLAAWLTGQLPPERAWADGEGHFLDEAKIDERMHLEINADTFGAADGMLFSSQAAVLDRMSYQEKAFDVTLSLRVRGDTAAGLHPVGGERRLMGFRPNTAAEKCWQPPPDIRAALTKLRPGDGVRMLLTTPVIFTGGWRPGWLDEQGVGTPPGCEGVKLKLVGVANDRWKAISGWSYETNGPKPIRRTVPAGGVYFFRLESGDAGKLADRWLESVCDIDQDRRDGFGLAVWGVWPAPKEA